MALVALAGVEFALDPHHQPASLRHPDPRVVGDILIFGVRGVDRCWHAGQRQLHADLLVREHPIVGFDHQGVSSPRDANRDPPRGRGNERRWHRHAQGDLLGRSI